ncbi:MAG: hypothetical protein ACJ746_03580 [Bryobacteraceae bacterium]
METKQQVIAAFDFFTVPTFFFRTLYCFFAIEHHRRRILHLNVTFHPTSDWIVQQLREAFPLPCPYRYVLFDHDAKFGNDVLNFLRSSDLNSLRTSIGSPWQNGTAERWVGSVRRELLDHVIPLNEYHLPASRGRALSLPNRNHIYIPAGRSSSSLLLVGCGVELPPTTILMTYSVRLFLISLVMRVFA